MFKFRTMEESAEERGLGALVTAFDERITSVGRFLRQWSLDEIPQLFNIWRGEMSLIGPRPTLKYQVEQYSDFQRRRLEVKPGITGWAQVNGRNEISWPRRIKYDVWYVDNYSQSLDFLIFQKTIAMILRREGVYTDDLDKFRITLNA